MASRKKKTISSAAEPALESINSGAAANIAADAETPLDYMLRIMRDPNSDDARRDAMAKVALPYMHARLPRVGRRLPDSEDGPIAFTWQPPQG